MMSGNFYPLLIGIDCGLITVNNEIIDAIFDIRGSVLSAKQPLMVRFIFSEQKRIWLKTVKPAIA
jgi:hypothetical protein